MDATVPDPLSDDPTAVAALLAGAQGAIAGHERVVDDAMTRLHIDEMSLESFRLWAVETLTHRADAINSMTNEELRQLRNATINHKR